MYWTNFLIFLGATVAAGASGVVFKPGDWYLSLRKPAWTPPAWVFPVVWTTLYVLMAISAARVAQLQGSGVALALWSLQIALNTLWTPVFFGGHRIRLGLAVIAVLWIAVAACLVALWRLDWVAGLLFVPYLAWISVALSLNAAIWRFNRPGMPSAR